MAIIRTSKDGRLTAAEFGAAVRSGLQFLAIPQGSVERTCVNLAPGKPIADGVPSGAPTMVEGASAIEFTTGSNTIQLAVPDYMDMTIYMGVKTSATLTGTDIPYYLASGVAPPLLEDTTANTFGTILRSSAVGNIRIGAGFTVDLVDGTADDQSVTDVIAATNTDWTFFVAKVYSSGGSKGVSIQNLTTAGSVVTESAGSLIRYPTRAPFVWGGGYAPLSSVGVSRHCWLSIHNITTSTDQDADVYAQVKARQLNMFGRTI